MNDIAQTAAIIAALRAEEQHERAPLFFDEFAELFVTDAARREAEVAKTAIPAIKEMLRYRTVFFDQEVQAAISGGSKQILLLGTGFDARALRFASPDVQFFEVDHNVIIENKKAIIEAGAVDCASTLIAGDYLAADFFSRLRRAGFDPAAPTGILWEGNTLYLQKEAVIGFLQRLRENLRRFVISFDYISEAVVTQSTGFDKLTELAKRFAKMGAPWTCGFNDIDALASHCDLAVARHHWMRDLRRRHGQMETAAEHSLFDVYAVCTMKRAG
jgi:methyltransferase (TIGR00027 family)